MKNLNLPKIEKLPEILFPPESVGRLALAPIVEPDTGMTLFHEYPDAPELRRIYRGPLPLSMESTLGRLDRLGRL